MPVSLLALSACAIGPDFKAPELPFVTEGWSQAEAKPETPISANSEPVTPETKWLTRFADPMLLHFLEVARAQNFSLKEAQAKVEEVAALRQVALSNLNPEIGLGAEYRRSKESNTLALFPGGIIESRYSVGAQLSWEIDLFGRIRRDAEAARAELGSALAAEQGAQLSILSQVAAQYIALRTAQHRLVAARGNLEAATASLALTEKRFSAGLSSELDVLRAKSLASEVEAGIPALESAEHVSRQQLEVLLGQSTESLKSELSILQDLPQPDSLPELGLPSELLRRRPDLLVAEHALAADTARVGVAIGTLFPKFSLTGELGFRSATQGTLFNDPSEVFAIAPGFSWPILSWHNLMAKVDAADARMRQKLAAYQNAVLSAVAEVEGALTSYRNLIRKRQHIETLLAANRRAAQLASQQYHEGLIDFIDKLEVDRALFSAEEQAVAVRGEIAQQFITLCKALGGGWQLPTPQTEQTSQAQENV